MAVPRILSVREARAGLTQVMKDVREPGADPIYVGAHRKPEVAIVSADRYAEHELTTEQAIQIALDTSFASSRSACMDCHPTSLLAKHPIGRCLQRLLKEARSTVDCQREYNVRTWEQIPIHGSHERVHDVSVILKSRTPPGPGFRRGEGHA